MNKPREQWGSRIGFLLAAAGSAIGLGNIWKFPGKAFEGGGGAFILIYLIVVLVLGVPLLITELALGRAGQADVVSVFQKTGHRGCSWIGWAGVTGAFVITCYYCHVGGWVLRYVFGYIVDAQRIYADPSGYFLNMLGAHPDGSASFPWTAVLFAGIFMILNAVIVIRGVKGGIERFNKFGMPALFVLLLILLIRALTLPGAGDGVRYMLSFDWSRMSFHHVLSALGQAFYSLSIGMAIMITYGSYLPETENIEKSSVLICVMDTAVALLAGFIIIPSVFATLGSDQVGKGGGFAFISLAGVFQQMPGGRFFGILFYLLLLFAATSSMISLIEGIVAFLTEQLSARRGTVTAVLCLTMFLIGCLYTCSQAAFPIRGIWVDVKNGITWPMFCDFMEFLTDRLLIPVCALGCCIFVGWIWKPEHIITEVRKNSVRFRLAKVYGVTIRLIAPLAILIILIMGFITGEALS